MNTYGYGIVKALVTDIDPDHAVKNAMNRINAAEREKIAAEYEENQSGLRLLLKRELMLKVSDYMDKVLQINAGKLPEV